MKLVTKIILGFVAVILIVGVIFGISVPKNFNKVIEMEVQIHNDYALISTALEARFEKMEALLNAVDGLQEHVETQLTKITDARARLREFENLNEITNEVENSFNDIVVLIEDNPNSYIATGAYLGYMAEITASINMVLTSKITYNDSVTKYNAFIRQFPRNLYLKPMGFTEKTLYDPQLIDA